jgi:metal-dependent amidase/aminoacylase/carboxypeptidase family protein
MGAVALAHEGLSHVEASTAKEKIRDSIYAKRDQFVRLAHDIHSHPQLAFSEEYAATRIADFLDSEGFDVRMGVCGLPTAFVATIGSGRMRLAFCAEYDALESNFLVQQAWGNKPSEPARDVPSPNHQDSPGFSLHACGHNLIAGAAVAAAAGLQDVVDDTDLTISVIGTPGEELIGLKEPPTGHLVEGKIALLQAGAFEGFHAALMVHPGPGPYGGFMPSKAGLRIRAKFSRTGKDVGILGPVEARRLEDALKRSLLPLHMAPSICTVEPQEQNADAQADLFIVGRSLAEVLGVLDAVRHCFDEAASAAGVSVELTEYSPIAEMRNDPLLAAAYSKNAKALGSVRARDEDVQREIRKVFENPQIPLRLRALHRLFPSMVTAGLFVDKVPVESVWGTDMGNVSYVIPAIHPGMGIGGIAPGHTVNFAAQADTDEAYRVMLDSGVALAQTALDAATDPAIKSHLFESAMSRAAKAKAN